MAEETKSTPSKSESSAPATTSSANADSPGQNGKGDAPRNCFSDKYRSNFDAIDWSK